MPELRHTLEAMLNPFFMVLCLIFLALIGLFYQWRYAPYRSILLLVFCTFLMLSTGWLPAFLTHYLENQYQAIKTPRPSVAWIVVLSGGQADLSGIVIPDRLYGSSIKRLLEGMRVHNMLPESKLLISGGGYASEYSEAESMHDLALMLRFPEKYMRLETKSLNTAEQIKAIKSMLKDEPFYLVTSAIHMPRAMALARKQGLKPIPAPTDYTYYWQDERWQKTWIPNAQNIVYFNIALHELLGISWAGLNQDI